MKNETKKTARNPDCFSIDICHGLFHRHGSKISFHIQIRRKFLEFFCVKNGLAAAWNLSTFSHTMITACMFSAKSGIPWKTQTETLVLQRVWDKLLTFLETGFRGYPRGIAGMFQTTCSVFIRDAIAIIDQLLAEYEKNPEK
jgi:hypothetical protein